MRGEAVFIRTYDGRLLKRRVWDTGDDVVFIADDEDMEKMLAGEEALPPIGFPKEDVFRYEPDLGESFFDRPDWSKLRLFSGAAVWHSQEADYPVTVIRELPLAPDGRRYVAIAESNSGIPLDEVEFIEQGS
jgi:hypothetical protein